MLTGYCNEEAKYFKPYSFFLRFVSTSRFVNFFPLSADNIIIII